MEEHLSRRSSWAHHCACSQNSSMVWAHSLGHQISFHHFSEELWPASSLSVLSWPKENVGDPMGSTTHNHTAMNTQTLLFHTLHTHMLCNRTSAVTAPRNSLEIWNKLEINLVLPSCICFQLPDTQGRKKSQLVKLWGCLRNNYFPNVIFTDTCMNWSPLKQRAPKDHTSKYVTSIAM